MMRIFPTAQHDLFSPINAWKRGVVSHYFETTSWTPAGTHKGFLDLQIFRSTKTKILRALDLFGILQPEKGRTLHISRRRENRHLLAQHYKRVKSYKNDILWHPICSTMLSRSYVSIRGSP
jgi:hypothetical protein